MDDLLIFDTDINNLKEIYNEIAVKINELKLKVNPKSTIVNLSNGLNFVGYNYRIVNNKLKIKHIKKTVIKINKKLNMLWKCDKLKYYRSLASYNGYLKERSNDFKMKSIEKYEYYKKNNLNKIVFIKEGSFYKTYNEDSYIIWNFFHYKWNNSTIAFGINPSNKVFTELRNKGIGYVIINDKVIMVNGNNEVYDSYLKISKFNFDKQNKINNLKERLEIIINNNIDNYRVINDLFNKIENVDAEELIK